jgi:2',3'-cyclic-nucleotide 2'-phosphodiesterase (5'-nucleotidase family)
MKVPRWVSVAIALSLLSAPCAKACGDDPTHPHLHQRLPSFAPITPPTRPLEWGDINIIHTTDSHGWLLGHQKSSFPEPNYSGDFGEFASFVSHMRQLAKVNKGSICLVTHGLPNEYAGERSRFVTRRLW